MKLILLYTLLIIAAHGSSVVNDYSEDDLEIVPANICAGVPNGVRIPHASDCRRFTLCDDQIGLTLTCREIEPFFDRCTQRCSADESVCVPERCPDPPTEIPCPGPHAPGCAPYDENIHQCECAEQWGCWGGECKCNSDVACRFDQSDAACIANCGCRSNCDCDVNQKCLCFDQCRCVEPPPVCPFPRLECVARCECDARCNCIGTMCTCDPNRPC